jgi:hypothetical protein
MVTRTRLKLPCMYIARLILLRALRVLFSISVWVATCELMQLHHPGIWTLKTMLNRALKIRKNAAKLLSVLSVLVCLIKDFN